MEENWANRSERNSVRESVLMSKPP